MTNQEPIRVLLVEDDEEDCMIAKEIISEIKSRPHRLEWAQTYQSGLDAMRSNKHDVCLVDYRLGSNTGLELLQAANANGCNAPVILLTGMGRAEVDIAAMKAGAADYLVKGRFDAGHLERSIRYALERKQAAARAAAEQARLASFGSEVGLALTKPAPLPEILQQCAEAMTKYLNAALAQVWIFDADQKVLYPRAHAGPVVNAVGSHLDIPTPTWDLPKLAEGKPVFIKSLAQDNSLENQAWAQHQKLASFAAQPLMLGKRLVGLMSVYSSETLSPTILQEMNSVAHAISLCLEHNRLQQALDVSERRFRSVVGSLHETVFQMNEFGHWTYLNPAWTALTGHSADASLGKLFLDFIHPEDRDKAQQRFLQLLDRSVEQLRYETRVMTADGSSRKVAGFSQLLVNPDGTILGTAGTFRVLP